MRKEEYYIMMESQDTHWWWKARNNIVKKILNQYFKSDKNVEIADAGSGYGANIKLLKKFGKVTALETNEDGIEYIKRKYENVDVIKWISPNKINKKYDLIVFADVLEHIEDDKKAIEWCYNHLKSDGCVLITVPAHMYLWTQMDKILIHFRRYNKNQIENLLNNNFKIEFISYWNLFLFPLKILFVLYDKIIFKINKNKKESAHINKPISFINYILEYIVRFESFFILKKLIPYGVSIVCLAKKINK